MGFCTQMQLWIDQWLHLWKDMGSVDKKRVKKVEADTWVIYQ